MLIHISFIHCLVLCFRAEAISDYFLFYFRKNLTDAVAIDAEDGHPIIIGNMTDKFHKGFADIFYRAIVVQMIVFDIGDYGHVGGKFQERAIAFISLSNHVISVTEDRVSMDIVCRCTKHDGGILLGFIENLPHHSRGGGFPMSTGYRNAPAPAENGCQHIGAMENGDALLFCFHTFRIVFRNSRRNDDAIAVFHMGCFVADIDLGSLFPEILQESGVGHVRAGYGIAFF